MTGDPVVEAASEVIGGPRGRYAAARTVPWMVPAAALSVMAALTVAIGILVRVPCIRSSWRGTEQFWNACYSDLPTTFRDSSVGAGLAAYLQGGPGAPVTGQPPLTGLLLTAVASLVPSGIHETARVKWYFALWAVLLTLLLLATIWLVVSSVRLPYAAAHVALSPVVALALFVSADFLGVALATAGMWAWGKRRPGLAGVLLGLGIAARSYPVLILVAVGLLALRTGRLRVFGRTAGAAAATVAVLGGGLWLVNPEAAGSSYSAWLASAAGYGSPWLLPQLSGHALPSAAVTILAVLGWLGALVAGAVLALSSARRPTLAEVSLVMVGIVLVTGKSFTVQSSLWLVPLVALAALPWRDHLIWAGTEAVNFVAVWLVIAAITVADRGLPNGWYAFFSMARVAAVGWLVAATWLRARQRWGQSELEVDELAGPITDEPDRLLVRFS